MVPRPALQAALLALCLTAAGATELWRRPVFSEHAEDGSSASSAQSAGSSGEQVSQALGHTSAALAQQFLRSSRAVPGMLEKPYDVPLIGQYRSVLFRALSFVSVGGRLGCVGS